MKTRITVNFSKSIKLLGFHEMDHNYWPLNLVILSTKKYIFSCARKKLRLNIFNLQNEVARVFSEQKMLFDIKSQQIIFNKRWELWKNLFV